MLISRSAHVVCAFAEEHEQLVFALRRLHMSTKCMFGHWQLHRITSGMYVCASAVTQATHSQQTAVQKSTNGTYGVPLSANRLTYKHSWQTREAHCHATAGQVRYT
eukprot:1948809-Rhodomonas_salina.2